MPTKKKTAKRRPKQKEIQTLDNVRLDRIEVQIDTVLGQLRILTSTLEVIGFRLTKIWEVTCQVTETPDQSQLTLEPVDTHEEQPEPPTTAA